MNKDKLQIRKEREELLADIEYCKKHGFRACMFALEMNISEQVKEYGRA